MGFYQISIILSSLLMLPNVLGCHKDAKPSRKNTSNFKKTTDSLPNYPEYLNTDYVLGKFDYEQKSDFVKVPNITKNIFLRKEVLEAFLKMNDAAKKDGLNFIIISGTRNFKHQKRIWDWKWNEKFKQFSKETRALKILEYSSMPGTSRHHWGTDLDLNNLENSYFEKGEGKKQYDWLVANASKFGFYQVYTSKKNGRTGYNEEKWHWSYVPLSSIYLNYYNTHIKPEHITGFEGAEFAIKIGMIKNYVNGINPEILNFTN